MRTVSVQQAFFVRFGHPLASVQGQERRQAEFGRRMTVSIETHFDGVRVPTALVRGALQSAVDIV